MWFENMSIEILKDFTLMRKISQHTEHVSAKVGYTGPSPGETAAKVLLVKLPVEPAMEKKCYQTLRCRTGFLAAQGSGCPPSAWGAGIWASNT
jgi:hypothetical protein